MDTCNSRTSATAMTPAKARSPMSSGT
jgi:hypothetical protein